MSLIESQFELKTKKGENKTEVIEAYRVLVNFWHCTKIHVPNVLSCVSQVFPHYTKHDASHSNAILDSIERMLGKEAIEKLSVTDLWLLLCSAYYHDIGMYLSGDKIKECFESEKFENFVFDIKDNPISPLNKYAVLFDSKDGKLKYDNCDLTLDSFNAAKYLLAEFFRKSHANRSGDMLQSDSSVTQMFSEINRLITIIADICRLHGAEFEEVMKFSDVENGVNGIEDYCHPRFVACMLRIGDLLDFDSSRVSKPSLDHLSTSIPYDSKIHNKKNYCIKHALITPEKVDVVAECKEPEVAFEIDNWFTLIRNEMSNQRNLWHDIASCTGIKGYPMCGTLETILSGYERIDNNLKPKFEIEGANAVKILQGSGIYKNKFRSIREILQNAVDATYLRIYLEQLKGKKEFAPESIEGFDKFLEICKQPEYQIEVRCKKKEIEEKSEKNEGENKNKKKKYIWHFEIQDHGIGLRKEDLKFLLKIGSGKNNKEKFDIIKKMPEYAKPSGIFGIGFQSVFLITDEVNIRSRYVLCDEVIDIKIGTPLKGGFALLKTEKNSFADKGTTISFDLMENTMSNNGDISYDSYYSYFDESFDFIKKGNSDSDVAKILNAIERISKESYLSIVYHNENKVKKTEDNVKKENESKQAYKRLYQDKDSNLIVELSKSQTISFWHGKFLNHRNLSVFYRNERVANNSLSHYINFLDFRINILSQNSEDVLSVSRDYLKIEYIKKIKEPLKKMMVDWLLSCWNSITDDDYKIAAAMFIEYYGTDETKKNIDEEKKKQIEENWKKYMLRGASLGEWINKRSIRIRNGYVSGFQNTKKNPIYGFIPDQEIQFLGHVLVKNGYNMYFDFYIHPDYSCLEIEVEFKKESNDSARERVNWSFWLKKYEEKKCRTFMPCFAYKELWVKSESIPEKDYDPMNLFDKVSYPKTVCPYIIRDGKFEWDCSDEVIQWVYENRCEKTVTIDDIERRFKDMKDAFSQYINANGKIIDKSKEANETKNNAEFETESKLIEQVKKKTESKAASKSKKQVEQKAKPKTAFKSPKQVEDKTKYKAAPKSPKQVKEKTKSKAAPTPPKQGLKKTDSDKKKAKKPQKAKTKKA